MSQIHTVPVVVILCSPPHPKVDEANSHACPGEHADTVCFARVDHAITLALTLGAVLKVCGDANESEQIETLATRAREATVEVETLIWPEGQSSTQHNLRMAFDSVRMLAASGPVDMWVVTDAWHVPRTKLIIDVELAAQIKVHATTKRLTLRLLPVKRGWQATSAILGKEVSKLCDFQIGQQTYRHRPVGQAPESRRPIEA